MLRTLMLFAVSVALIAPALADEAPARPDGLIVHEWGTFTSMQGSNGVVLEGLHHEEEDLPGFVYTRSRSPETYSGVVKKMETPVTYFYSARPMRVNVTVGFPKGVLTQWYPIAHKFTPALGTSGKAISLENGRLVWKYLYLQPGRSATALPKTAADDPWNFARQVDAATVIAPSDEGSQEEKFLFYRGLGKFDLPVKVTTSGAGKLRIENGHAESMNGLVLMQVEGDRGRFSVLGDLAGETARNATSPFATGDPEPLETLVPKIQAALVKILVADGLYGKEAWAMVRTWTKSYFRTPGLRLLYLIPQKITDRVIPLTVTPKPRVVKRVMVARIECLTPEHELSIETAIRNLGAARYDRRARAQRRLFGLGRFAEPNLRRLIAGTADLEVRTRAQQLLDALYPGR